MFVGGTLEQEIVDNTSLSSDRQTDQFQAFFELSGVGATIVDISTYRFLRANPAFCEMLGYSEDDLKQKTSLEITHPEDRAEDQAAIDSARYGKSPHWQSEKRYIRKDGQNIWVCVNGTIVRNDKGQPVHGVATIQNVTDKKFAESALKASEQRFKALANSIPQLAWETDPAGNITWYNQQWYDYTGTTLEQMQRHGWVSVHHPDHTDRVVAKWTRHLQTGEFWEDTFPLRSKDGEYRWFLSRARQVRNEQGKVMHWFGTNTDITEQLRIEQELKESKEAAEKANAAKTQFLANMSHEIRTPIGAIMGFTGLLRNPSNTEEETASFMSVIERNSQQLLRLIDEILDLSKIEAGKISIEKNSFSLIAFLTDLASLKKLKANENSNTFLLSFEGKIPSLVSTDQTRLKQILTNIVGNAIKFTEHGTIELTVKFEDPYLEFQVKDNGRGISAEQAQRLFRPFEQADPSMTRKYGGTGLGLILSKKLSEALGGSLELQWSELGKGSLFVIRIKPDPVPEAEWVDAQSLGSSTKVESHSYTDQLALNGVKVLVVDDSLDNRVLVSTFLKKAGAIVTQAEDGSIAVRKAMHEAPDMILMDIQMPVMDGHKATQTLRAQGFEKPIIALTAHAMREEKERCFESGCNEFMTKPINRDLLIETLTRFRPV